MVTTSLNKALTYAISYGFVEGHLHSRSLQKALGQQGYKEAPFAEADIVIAHSAGCWLIPETAHPKLVLYIGMPLQEARARRAWLTTNFITIWRGNFVHNLNMRFKNSYHAMTGARRNIDMMLTPQYAKPSIFPTAQSVFVANRFDDWPKGEYLTRFLTEKPWAFISLQGLHNDVWHNTEQYIAIIDNYARLLAQTGK